MLEGEIVAPDFYARAKLSDLLKAHAAALKRGGSHKWSPPVRRNRLPNPSFETNVLGWAPGPNIDLTRGPGSPAIAGTQVCQARMQASVVQAHGSISTDYGSYGGVAGTTRKIFPISIKATAGRAIAVQLNEAGGATAEETFGSASATANGGWQRVHVQGTIQRGDRTSIKAMVTVENMVGNEVFFVDAAMIEHKVASDADYLVLTPASYFDGDSEGARWDGSPHAAPSYMGALPRQRYVRAFELPDPTGGPVLKRFQLVLVSPDPLAYSQETKTSGDIAIGGTGSVFNAGERETFPRVRIYGAVTDPIAKNLTNGNRQVALTGITIADGTYVEIHMRDETIYLSTGVNQIGKLAISSSAFWSLLKGANSIQITGTSPGANAKGVVVHEDAW